MAHVLVFVLNDVEHCPAVLEAWEDAGVPGVTILEGTGLGRLRSAMRDDLPLIPSLRDLLQGAELHHRTLFSVIEDEGTLQRVIAATEKIIGDFNQQHTGLLFAFPVTIVRGLRKQGQI